MAKRRHTRKDIESAIFNPNGNYEEVKYEQILDETTFYTSKKEAEEVVGGYPTISEDGDKVYAKKILMEDESIRYYIKFGGNRNSLINPYSDDETYMNLKESKFVGVSKSTFNNYIDFLRTKNLAYLYNAEREYR
jgi:hypothetical protein